MVSSQLSHVSMVIPVTLAAVAFESLWKPQDIIYGSSRSWTNLGEGRHRWTALLYLVMYFLTSPCCARVGVRGDEGKGRKGVSASERKNIL